MSIVKQESLFSLEDFMKMNQKNRYEMILTAVDTQSIVLAVYPRSHLGRPEDVNYVAVMNSLIVRIVERIPTIKDLVKRLKNDIAIRFDCGFTCSDEIPSEASYSRFVKKLSESKAMEKIQEELLLQAIQEGFLADDCVAMDSTHIESRDHFPEKETKPKPEKKKRGRKSKADQAKYAFEKAVEELCKPLYEQKIEMQLDASLQTLESEMPKDPKWGIKKNSEGKNVFWFGYKAHLAVGTKSQYILKAYLSSGNLNDSKAAIPLLKSLEGLPLSLNHCLLDAGYDYVPIYEQALSQNIQPLIAYNKRRESEFIGFDENFAPTCVREHSYRYDSFDSKYKVLKYKCPKECKDCPLSTDSLCQKYFKIKQSTDVRKYSAPGRGTTRWKQLFAQRTAVERVFAYLKGYFQLDNIRHRTGRKAKVHLDIVALVYNALKLTIDRLNKEIQDNLVIAA